MPSFGKFMQEKKKNFILLLAGNGSAQAFLFILSPVLLRFYGPQEFGVYGMFIALSATIAGVAGWRIEFAIPVARSSRSAATMLILAMIVALPTVLLLSAFVLALSGLGMGRQSLRGLSSFAGWLPVAAYGILLFQVTNYWLLWHQRYRAVVRVRWSQGLSLAIVQLAGAWLNLRGFGLIAGHSAGQIIGAFSGLKGELAQLTLALRSMKWRRIVRLLVALRRYPSLMVPASLMNMVGQHLPVIFIGMLFGLGPAGFYATAQRICGAPLSLVGQAVGQMYTAEASRAIVSNQKDLTSNFLNLMRFMVPLALLFLFAILALSPFLTVIAFGETWRELGTVMQILAVVFVLDFIITPVSLTLSFTKRYQQQMMWDAIRLVAVLATFIASVLLELTFHKTMIVFAVLLASCQSYLIYIIWCALRFAECRSPGREYEGDNA
jgi:O-antigen/teichoic acid export membrane protein